MLFTWTYQRLTLLVCGLHLIVTASEKFMWQVLMWSWYFHWGTRWILHVYIRCHGTFAFRVGSIHCQWRWWGSRDSWSHYSSRCCKV